jgi:hypothetical protein
MTALEILQRCIADIKSRAAVRDLPEGERSVPRAVAAFNALTGHRLSEVDGWLFMAILKAARGTAGTHHADDWIDMAAYAALVGEAAERAAKR